MKTENLREMTDDELQRKEEQYEKQLLNLRFQLATKQIENPMKVREARRGIARVKTIRRERRGESS
jgi:large subunit ribosomal protein L29